MNELKIIRELEPLLYIRHDGYVEKNSIVECLCFCDKIFITRLKDLKSKKTKSCGCLKRKTSRENGINNTTHGLTKSRIYKSWKSMKARCNNATDDHYLNYGARGITVCERWINSFETFLADMGERPKGKTLDRIDVNGNYEPSNCRWATSKEQTRNKRNTKLVKFNGKELPLVELCENMRLNYKTVDYRLRNGYNIDEALTMKLYKRR